MAAPVSGRGHASNVAHRAEVGQAAENPFTQQVADAVVEGKISDEALKDLAAPLAQVESPKERAQQVNQLREAIRDNPDIAPKDRNQLVRALNQELAKVERSWAQRAERTVEPPTLDPKPTITAQPSANLDAPVAPEPAVGTERRSDPSGLLSVGVLKANAPPRRF